MTLEHSPEGLNCVPLFDKSANTISIEVEGEEDIPFWDAVISTCINTNGYSINCIPQKGCKEIIKHLIENGDSQDFIAIIDSEYDEIIHDKELYKQNPFAVFTIRHSIENYLFCYNSLAATIKKINRTSENKYRQLCLDFQKELSERLKKLLYYDCKKEDKPEIFPDGLSILGSNSNIAKFTTKNNYLPDTDKIDNFIENNHINIINTDDIENLFNDKNLFYFLNGHFITYSIFTFINTQIKKGKMKLGKDSLYMLLYEYCPNCRNKCSDFSSVINRLETAVNGMIKKFET